MSLLPLKSHACFYYPLLRSLPMLVFQLDLIVHLWWVRTNLCTLFPKASILTTSMMMHILSSFLSFTQPYIRLQSDIQTVPCVSLVSSVWYINLQRGRLSKEDKRLIVARSAIKNFMCTKLLVWAAPGTKTQWQVAIWLYSWLVERQRHKLQRLSGETEACHNLACCVLKLSLSFYLSCSPS